MVHAEFYIIELILCLRKQTRILPPHMTASVKLTPPICNDMKIASFIARFYFFKSFMESKLFLEFF